MLTEKDISSDIQRQIKSPIRIGSLRDLNIKEDNFLKFFRPFFDHLEDDVYLMRQKQMLFLLTQLPHAKRDLKAIHQGYFEGMISSTHLNPFVAQLDEHQKEQFRQLSIITRQRSIAYFDISWINGLAKIKQCFPTDFQQKVNDFREWKRTFSPVDERAISSHWFQTFLQEIFIILRQIHPKAIQGKITVHFMRTLAYKNIAGDNAPEGIHEDGTQYIVSALVIDRKNARGGLSRIYEKLTTGQQELLYKKELEAGEFIFQADTGEELTFGNDLWHNVSSISPINENQVATRDIIGLDIDLVK